MQEDKKIPKKKEEEIKELNLDEIEEVTGGSINNVKYTPTTDISEDTKSKV